MRDPTRDGRVKIEHSNKNTGKATYGYKGKLLRYDVIARM